MRQHGNIFVKLLSYAIPLATIAMAWLWTAAPAAAMGVRTAQLAPIQPAPEKITVDGRLDEWKSISGYTINPLTGNGTMGDIFQTGGDAAVARLINHRPSATFKFCYDPQDLYVAVIWHDRHAGINRTPAGDAAHWSRGGEGFELHLQTDRTVHLACWPVGRGGKLSVMERIGDSGPWIDVSSKVSAAGRIGPGKTVFTEELQVPWSAITATGAMPTAGTLKLGVDCVWNAVPASMLAHLRQASVVSGGIARGIAMNFLTARPGMAAAGYIASPSDWGSLALGQSPHGNAATLDHAGTTSLFKMPVPLAATPPAVNGTLRGWNKNLFRTAVYQGSFWGKRFYCQLAAQYDRHDLYIAAHFRSFGPMTNAKRESTLQGYGGGDALQIRLSDGKKKVNLCGWYDSADKSPALTADRGDLPSPFLLKQGAREAFAADADGRGYVQEVALPWKVLFGGTPQRTARLAATFQLWWADLTPRFSFYTTTTLARRGALAVRYKMPADDDLSLGLFDPQGHLLRWLMRDDYCYAGPNRVFWNGLDQWGQPVPPGHYVIKGLYHPALTTQYKMTLDNPGTPPWPTPDNHGDWLADESIPQAAATDGKWVFLGAPDWEKGVGIIAVNQKGQRQWGSRVAAGGRCISLAVDGNYLYALYSGPISTDTSRIYLGHHAIGRALLVCLDKRTGNPARFSLKHPAMRIATWRYRQDYHWLWTLRNHHSFSAATYGGQPRYFATDVGETTDALGVVAIGNRVYASLFYNNKIEVVNALTGKPTGQTIAVQAPVGVCAVDAHTLLAVSGKEVVKINLAGNTVTPLITSHLVAPFDVTRDAVGRIYVSDWGKSFQVKVFDAHGKFLHAVGKPGGRPWVGKWVSDGMLLPRGIAVTDAGKLWVAEEDGSPCRISVWNAQTGTLLKQYIGPTPYGGGTFFWVDPKDPTQMVAEGTRFKVNLVKKTSTPEAIVFRRQGIDDPFTPDGHGTAWGHCQVMYHDGHQYVAMNVSGNMLTIMRREGDVYRPVAALGSEGGPISPKLKLDGTQIDCWDSDLGHHEYEGYFPPCFRYHFGQNYSWSDTNGDHLVQPDEMHWVKTVHGVPYKKGTQPTLGDGWGTALGPDWSYYASGDYRDHVVIFRLDLKGWSANGAPLYDMADAKPIVTLPHGWSINGLYVTRDNRLIVCYNYEWGSSPDTIGCYNRDGRYLWAIARPVAAGNYAGRGSAGLLTENIKNVHANNAVYDFKLPGVGDVVGTWLWHGNIRPYLFTTDGLYVGTLLQNTLLGPKALWGESYTYFFQTPAGTPYVVNGGTDAEDILQIHGLKPGQVGRFTTSYTLTAADVAEAAAMRKVPHAPPPAPQPKLAVTWLAQAPTIDGNLKDWNFKRGVHLSGALGRSARIALRRDAKNLYLAYKVHEPTVPMTNGGGDWQTLFISGDCVDLMLQTDPDAIAHRRRAGPGDERLLLSSFQGRPIAVLYQPVIPGAKGGVRLSTAHFDRITRLTSAQVVIRRNVAGGYYTLEAKVPLKALHLNVQPGVNLRGDVGVVFADQSGHSRALRLYYYNHDTQMVNDLPTEATLQPDKWGPIIMPLGSNLLKDGDFSRPLMPAHRGKKAAPGWSFGAQKETSATISTKMPFTGAQCLLLKARSGFLRVGQTVPVIPGHLYSLRYRARGEAFEAPHEDLGHPTTVLWAEIDWHVAPRGRTSIDYSGFVTCSEPKWKTFYNWRGFAVPSPYKAPAGATTATIVFGFKSHLKDHMARAYISDVEFVDVTAGAKRALDGPRDTDSGSRLR